MAWKCAHCKDYVENGRTTCSSCGVPRGRVAADLPEPPAAVEAGARDLKMEAHLGATALWYRVGGLLGAGLIVFGWIFGHRDADASVWSAPIALAVCAALYLLGAALGRRSNGARVLAGVFAALSFVGTAVSSVSALAHGTSSLIGVAFSVALSSAYLWVFWSSRSRAICAPGYQRLVAASPRTRPSLAGSVFFWIPLVGVALFAVLLILVLGVAGLASLAS